jgi:glycosyl-4,4'-diaponeurosporenoate acyltransferase
MPIELPTGWIVALNCAGWPLIQMGLAWLFTRMPAAWFKPSRPFAAEEWLYRHLFQVGKWKDRLPDAASWFSGGFAKRSLAAADPGYLSRFIRETRRGELCHWCALAFLPVFFLWNPWWGDLIMILYATAANLPCILAQRHNRLRLLRLLEKVEGKRHNLRADNHADACFLAP